MINRYFQQELGHLRELGAEFSRKHPAVAPMLSGPAADPDVERLLEGVAFLTAMLREKLDDEFPEIIHELIHLIWPHYLRPIPCTTIVAFSPKPTLKQPITIPAGVEVASIPVEGTSCIFRTCYDVELHPIDLVDAAFVESAGSASSINLVLELRGSKLADWEPRALRLFFAGGYAQAADIYFLLRHHLKEMVITPSEGGRPVVLSPDQLKPVGFAEGENLIPYPGQSLPAYRVLQEYFILPEKFLFLDIVGWDRWHERGEGFRFEIRFELNPGSFEPPRIRKDNFILSATPAINIFSQDADPIRLDHRGTEYPVRPSGSNASHYQVYSVEDVVGFVQGTAKQRNYVPFEVFNPQSQDNPVYHVKSRRSPVKTGLDVYLSVAYPPEIRSPALETLSIELLCTNGALPEGLQVGDISVLTSSSPEFADFRNILPPTSNVLPPLGSNLLWRLLSHLSLNYVSLAKAENLVALLELYVFSETRDRAAVVANRKRIEGIQHVETKASNRLVSGIMMRGQDVTVKLRQDHFAGQGDFFLFGSVLDYFLGCYASMNSYTQFIVEEVLKGDRYQWPVRIGEHFLI